MSGQDFQFDDTPPGTVDLSVQTPTNTSPGKVTLPDASMDDTPPGAVTLPDASMDDTPPGAKDLSAQEMVNVAPDPGLKHHAVLTVSGAGETTVNGDYSQLPDPIAGKIAWQRDDGYQIHSSGSGWAIVDDQDTAIYWTVLDSPFDPYVDGPGTLPRPTVAPRSSADVPPGSKDLSAQGMTDDAPGSKDLSAQALTDDPPQSRDLSADAMVDDAPGSVDLSAQSPTNTPPPTIAIPTATMGNDAPGTVDLSAQSPTGSAPGAIDLSAQAPTDDAPDSYDHVAKYQFTNQPPAEASAPDDVIQDAWGNAILES